MKTILILYATVDGHTHKICENIATQLQAKNCKVTMTSVAEGMPNPKEYDKIIIASSIRYGYHNSLIEKFISENASVLNEKPSAFISVNLVARKPEKSTAETNPYVVKFLNKIAWKPTKTAVFAGVLNYQIYSFWDKILIKLIMLITDGPTRSKTAIEYTNWESVRQFTDEFYAI